MRGTDILVRWQGGWRWVEDDDVPLRIEMCQGHAGDGLEIVRKATAERATYKLGQTQITVGIDPAVGDPVPGVDWIEGDELNADGAWQEVEALACEVDDATGRVIAVPVFGTVIDEPEERVSRTMRSIGGFNGGTSHIARPIASILPPGIRPPGDYSPGGG